MQSDNATNFPAEIAQELMNASEVAKVTPTHTHSRGNGLVERQNKTLLTLLRVESTRLAGCRLGLGCAHKHWDESWVLTTPLDTLQPDFCCTCSNMALKTHPTLVHISRICGARVQV